jgi:hypothetical protein
VESIKEDDLFAEVNQEFDKVMNGLWITNYQYRNEFAGAYRNNDYLWRHLIDQYQKCLCSYQDLYRSPRFEQKNI